MPTKVGIQLRRVCGVKETRIRRWPHAVNPSCFRSLPLADWMPTFVGMTLASAYHCIAK
ncbi:MAG: hypothetical protein ABTQ34_08170 [Bdellovibrionales bacterium]